MKFSPKTEQELASMNLIDPGQYPFAVVDAEECVSKSTGAPMIKLKLRIIDHQERERYVFDYLIDSMPHKLAHFAKGAGLTDKYNAGQLEAGDCLHKRGNLDLVIQKSRDPAYGDKNSVKDYIVEKTVASSPHLQQHAEEVFKDDETIPF